MEIKTPKEHLLIFTQTRSFADHFIYENKIFDYYSRRNIHYFDCSRNGQGFLNVDILFIGQWWIRDDSRNILEIIDRYFYMGAGRIIGDEKFIPPDLWERYKMRDKEIFEPVKNRFELLDL